MELWLKVKNLESHLSNKFIPFFYIRDNIHLSQLGANTIARSITDKIFKYNKKNF